MLYEKMRVLCQEDAAAPRSRLVGGGFKLPGAASVKSCGGERPWLKGVALLSRQVWIREPSANEPLTTHRKILTTTSKPESLPYSGISMADAYVLAMRCPVFRRRDSNSGFSYGT